MEASGGSRIDWSDIDSDVRSAVENALGASVVAARNQSGGFSPGLAARCRLDDGQRVFIKAVSPAQNEHACRIHRREAEIAAELPASAPAPRLRHVHDDGTWVVLVLDDVDGRQPTEPWTWAELDHVLPAIGRLHESLSPNPVDTAQSVHDRYEAAFFGWRRFATGDGRVDGLDPWCRDRIGALADLEHRWHEGVEGHTLLHTDLRADNMLVDDRGGVWFVDWPWACVGAPFVDLVLLLPSVGLGGGPRPTEVIERFGLFADVEPDALVRLVVALAGFFLRSSVDAPPPGLPTLRAFQRAQGDVAVDWLRTMID